uniref:CAC1F_C domain-containing protein n=1 Tax=Macrostomum lignano TaxID=282301 RepID=A0A1I8I2L4_9PLAT
YGRGGNPTPSSAAAAASTATLRASGGNSSDAAGGGSTPSTVAKLDSGQASTIATDASGSQGSPPIFIPDRAARTSGGLLMPSSEMDMTSGMHARGLQLDPRDSRQPIQPMMHPQLHHQQQQQQRNQPDRSGLGRSYGYGFSSGGFAHPSQESGMQQQQQQLNFGVIATESSAFDGLKDEDLFDDEYTDCPASSRLEYEDYYWSHRPLNQYSTASATANYGRRSHKRRSHQHPSHHHHGDQQHPDGSSSHWNASSASSSRWYQPSSRSGSIKQMAKRQFSSYSYAPV